MSISDCATLTVSPSSTTYDVNQWVTLDCDVPPTIPIVVTFVFKRENTTECNLEQSNGGCKNVSDSCTRFYNATCLNDTHFSLKVKVPQTWNRMNISCRDVYTFSESILFQVNGRYNSFFL